MCPSLSRAKRSFCDAQIWMNFIGAGVRVPSRCESSFTVVVIGVHRHLLGAASGRVPAALSRIAGAARSAFAAIVCVRITLENSRARAPRHGLALAFVEATLRERALSLELIEVVHGLHRVFAITVGTQKSEVAPRSHLRGAHYLPALIETAKLTVSAR